MKLINYSHFEKGLRLTPHMLAALVLLNEAKKGYAPQPKDTAIPATTFFALKDRDLICTRKDDMTGFTWLTDKGERFCYENL